MLIKGGKPTPTASGIGCGILGAPLLFFGLPWLIRMIARLFGAEL